MIKFQPTAEELTAIRQTGAELDLSDEAVMRQALRFYQLRHTREKAGETFSFSGDAQRAAEFAGPLAVSKQEQERESKFDALVSAFRAGAIAVHRHWRPDEEAIPDFTEAAHDYARDALEGS
jgi:hypothetical protein